MDQIRQAKLGGVPRDVQAQASKPPEAAAESVSSVQSVDPSTWAGGNAAEVSSTNKRGGDKAESVEQTCCLDQLKAIEDFETITTTTLTVLVTAYDSNRSCNTCNV